MIYNHKLQDLMESRLPYANELGLGLSIEDGTIVVFNLEGPLLQIPIKNLDDIDGEIARLFRVLVPQVDYTVEIKITRGIDPILQLSDPVAVKDLEKFGLKFEQTPDGYISVAATKEGQSKESS